MILMYRVNASIYIYRITKLLYTLRWWWWSCYASVPYFIPLLKQGKSIYMSSDMLTNTHTLTHTHTHTHTRTSEYSTHSHTQYTHTHRLTHSHTLQYTHHTHSTHILTSHTLPHSHTLQYTHHIQNHHDQQGRISSWSLWLWGWWTPRKFFFYQLSINISIIFLKH